jgi:hypothetical protein
MPDKIDHLCMKLDRIDAKLDRLGENYELRMAEVTATLKLTVIAVTAAQAIVIAAVLVIRLFPLH